MLTTALTLLSLAAVLWAVFGSDPVESIYDENEDDERYFWRDRR